MYRHTHSDHAWPQAQLHICVLVSHTLTDVKVCTNKYSPPIFTGFVTDLSQGHYLEHHTSQRILFAKTSSSLLCSFSPSLISWLPGHDVWCCTSVHGLCFWLQIFHQDVNITTTSLSAFWEVLNFRISKLFAFWYKVFPSFHFWKGSAKLHSTQWLIFTTFHDFVIEIYYTNQRGYKCRIIFWSICMIRGAVSNKACKFVNPQAPASTGSTD